MAKRKDGLTELVLKRVEELRAQHGVSGRPMEQKRLARRSQQTYARVHKFLSGQMPYPPLDFLDALLRSFGDSLANVLKGETPPTTSDLPILREDVRALAHLLDDATPEVVEETRRVAALFVSAQTAAVPRSTPRLVSGPGKPPGAGDTSNKRGGRPR